MRTPAQDAVVVLGEGPGQAALEQVQVEGASAVVDNGRAVRPARRGVDGQAIPPSGSPTRRPLADPGQIRSIRPALAPVEEAQGLGQRAHRLGRVPAVERQLLGQRVLTTEPAETMERGGYLASR